jgi:hypothetical protein
MTIKWKPSAKPRKKAAWVSRKPFSLVRMALAASRPRRLPD